MDLVQQVYEMTAYFPRDELYGLTGQLRRAAVSIASNIAEGQGRKSRNDFGRHLSMAHGSLREVETQILIAARLGYVKEDVVDHLMELSGELGRLINGLRNSLAGSINRQPSL